MVVMTDGMVAGRTTAGPVTRRELSRRELNRATLARQLLLERSELTAVEAVGRLVGLQGQAPDAPYVGLWSRLAGFEPAELATALIDRRLVRTNIMRATVHLMTAQDAVALHPLIQPVRDRAFRGSPFARAVADVPLAELLALGEELVTRQPMTLPQLKPVLADRWPGRDPTSLAYAVAYAFPLVQVPPRGVWGSTGPAALTTVAAWLTGGPPTEPATLDELVLRYLGAFGPAGVRDVQLWSGLTRLGEVVRRLRGRLLEFTDEHGATLYDLPDAPRPDPDTPAPPRFLPEYDNLLLSHADRRRVNPAGRPVPLPPGNGARTGTLLVRGDFAGTWKLSQADRTVTLTVTPFERLADSDAAEVIDEGAALLSFLAGPPGSHQVLIV
jgi:hypothetical protein